MTKTGKLSACLILVVVFGVVPVEESRCGGIPVFDAANLAEQLRQYLQDLKGFQEMLNQSTLMTEQGLQMLREYEQLLRQYNHYLNQLKSIRHMISDQDWMKLMRYIKSYYGKDIRAAIAAMDAEDEDYEAKVDEVLENYGHVPGTPAQIEIDAQGLGIWSDQYERETNEDYRNYNLYKDRMRMVSDNAKKDERFKEDIAKHDMIVKSLGDESDLATLQAMAIQKITIMKQNSAILQTMNQILLNIENEQALEAAKRARAREAELDRLKNRKSTQPLGRDRWGDF